MAYDSTPHFKKCHFSCFFHLTFAIFNLALKSSTWNSEEGTAHRAIYGPFQSEQNSGKSLGVRTINIKIRKKIYLWTDFGYVNTLPYLLLLFWVWLPSKWSRNVPLSPEYVPFFIWSEETRFNLSIWLKICYVFAYTFHYIGAPILEDGSHSTACYPYFFSDCIQNTPETLLSLQSTFPSSSEVNKHILTCQFDRIYIMFFPIYFII